MSHLNHFYFSIFFYLTSQDKTSGIYWRMKDGTQMSAQYSDSTMTVRFLESDEAIKLL